MKRILPALFAGMLAGCTVGPDYHAPTTQVADQWAPIPPPTTAPASQPTSLTNPDEIKVARWWTTFNDPELDSLIARSILSNYDIRQAESRIRSARASETIASSAFWPSANASGSYSHSRGSGPLAGPHDLFSAGLDAAWELDVFGGVRRGIESAEAQYQATIEDRNDILVTLAAEVAIDYMDLRGFQQQIVISKQNLEAQKRSLDIARKRYAGGQGFASKLDVSNAEADVATTLAQIPALESSAQQSIYSLSILLGLQPEALNGELSSISRIPPTPPLIPIGLPSELMRRRADIRRAEASYHSATAQIGVATADLFPKFSLTGDIGIQSSKFSGLGNSVNRFYGFGPSATWNVFDAGRIRANIKVQNEFQEQALDVYQQTVIVALKDVQSALVAYAKEQQRRGALYDAVIANRSAVELSTTLYTAGQIEFINVITAQRSLYGAEDALVRSNHDVATNLVALYKALGGGWEANPSPATQP